MKNETHENIDDEFDEYYIYKMDKLSLDENIWCDSVFEGKLEIINDMKILNSMNHTHNNKVNNIAKCHLLHDILNPSKQTKNINSHYYSILHVCMNYSNVRVKF